MPKDMEDLLFQLNDPDIIRDIQGKWDDLVAANDNYERNYPQQFANLVEGNLKFKEQNSIPTPAEQLQAYESIIIAEIEEHLEEKQRLEKEETYELEQDEKAGPDKDNIIDQFQLTFSEVTTPQKEPARGKEFNDLEKSQELNVTWLQEYKEELEREQKSIANGKEIQPEDPYRLQLNFGRLEDLDRDRDIEPDEPEMEKE